MNTQVSKSVNIRKCTFYLKMIQDPIKIQIIYDLTGMTVNDLCNLQPGTKVIFLMM